MKKITLLLAMTLASLLMFSSLTACSTGTAKTQLNVYNWGEYIADGSDDSMDIIAEFEKENPDIDVVYNTFASNEEMYAKIVSGSAEYDIIIPSEYMISKMMGEGMLQKIDYSKLTNYENIDEEFKGLHFDPENEYTVPYTWGTLGIIYNTTMVEEEVDSWDILWDEKYEGEILMINNPRDAFGIALKELGYSLNTTDLGEIDEAAELLKEQKPLVQAYVMDEIFDKMEIGEAAISVYYAGDAITMIEDNPDLKYVVPKEGSNQFVDAMVIPSTCEEVDEAHRFIDFLLREDVALENIQYIGYSTPMSNVKELLPDELKNSEIAYPAQDLLDNCESFINLPDEVNEYTQELWIEIISGS